MPHMLWLVLIAILVFFTKPSQAVAWQDFATIPKNPGDKIGCQLHSVLGFFNLKHWMLAVDQDHVVHMIGDYSTGEGWIYKQQVNEVSPSLFKWGKCVNAGLGRYGSSAVQRAEEYVNRQMHYSLLSCNCGHYVRYWADGGTLC